jgi:fluoride ion exporter CrcB/FEX
VRFSEISPIFKYVLVLCGAILIFGGIERYLVKQHAPEQGVRVWFIEQCIWNIFDTFLLSRVLVIVQRSRLRAP